MEITKEQYEKIEKYLPIQRGNVRINNLQLINAILYVAENGCKWRALPKSYGNWHTIYVRMNRGVKMEYWNEYSRLCRQKGLLK